MFEDTPDPYERLEDIENVQEHMARLLQKTSQVCANNTWLLAQVNNHLADVTQALNELAEVVKDCQTRIERLEEEL